jgi:hypothetical protein
MTTQPEALRLADILQHKLPSIECLGVAAAELRRLHRSNTDLLALLKESRKIIRASSSRNLVKDWDGRATTAIAKGEAK